MISYRSPAFLATLLLSSSAFGQQIGGDWSRTWSATGALGDRYGADLVSIGDIDLDGTTDIAVGVPGRGPLGGMHPEGAVEAISGRTGAVLWTFIDALPFDEVGINLFTGGDLDSDGWNDLLVEGRGGGGATGLCVVLSGRTGTLIRQHDGTAGGGQPGDFGHSMAMIDDIDGDGIDEYLVGDPDAMSGGSGYKPGSVDCYSGATGVLLWRTFGLSNSEYFGYSVVRGADWDQDGNEDILVGAIGRSPSGGVDLLDAQTGVRNGRVPIPPTVQWGYGSVALAVEDLSGDSVDDLIVVSASGLYLQEMPQGQVIWERSVINGLVDLRLLGDFDQDGVPDFGYTLAGPRACEVRSLQNGEVLRVVNPAPFGAVRCGASFDRDGDGVPELVVGDHSWGGIATPGAVAVYKLSPFLYTAQTEVSASQGGTLSFSVDFPSSEAGRPFAVLASHSGLGPASVSGVWIPLTSDPLFGLTTQAQVPGSLSGLRGILDASGDAAVSVSVAPGGLTSMIGYTLHFSAVSLAGAAPQLVSVAVPVRVQP